MPREWRLLDPLEPGMDETPLERDQREQYLRVRAEWFVWYHTYRAWYDTECAHTTAEAAPYYDAESCVLRVKRK